MSNKNSKRREKYLKEYNKKYYQRPEVRERRKEYDRKRRQTKKYKKYKKKWDKEYNQRPEVKKRMREYRNKNKERIKIRQTEYDLKFKKNHHKCLECNNKIYITSLRCNSCAMKNNYKIGIRKPLIYWKGKKLPYENGRK